VKKPIALVGIGRQENNMWLPSAGVSIAIGPPTGALRRLSDTRPPLKVLGIFDHFTVALRPRNLKRGASVGCDAGAVGGVTSTRRGLHGATGAASENEGAG
jgi:hypothetical protein